MDKDNLISVGVFCLHHEVEESFLDALYDIRLIEIISQGNDRFIMQSQLPEIEKMVRLHHELDINPQGLDAVLHLLNKIELLRGEVAGLKGRLKIYE